MTGDLWVKIYAPSGVCYCGPCVVTERRNEAEFIDVRTASDRTLAVKEIWGEATIVALLPERPHECLGNKCRLELVNPFKLRAATENAWVQSITESIKDESGTIRGTALKIPGAECYHISFKFDKLEFQSEN